MGLSQLTSDSYNEIENIVLLDRIKSSRREENRNPFYVHFPSESDSDFLGFESTHTNQRFTRGVICAEIHTEQNSENDTQLENAGRPTSSLREEIYLEHFKCLTRLFQHITSSGEKTLYFLKAAQQIPQENTPCPSCKTKNRKGSGSDKKCNLRLMCSGGGSCKYKVSPFTGTFFDGTCRVSLGIVIHIIYCFIHQVRVSDAIRENEVSKNTITDYYNYCREVCALAFEQNFHQIGGPGEIVEIDESKFFQGNIAEDEF